MPLSPEEQRQAAEERAEGRADNSGGHVDPYEDNLLHDDTTKPAKTDNVISRPGGRRNATVPREESERIAVLGGDFTGSVPAPLSEEQLAKNNKNINYLKRLLGGQAVGGTVETPSKPITRPGPLLDGETPKQLAKRLGVPVIKTKDEFGNTIYVPQFPKKTLE